MVNRLESNQKILKNKYVDKSIFIRIIVLLAVVSAFVGHLTIIDYTVATVWILSALFLFNKDDFWILFIPLSIFENTIFFYFTDYTIFKIMLLLAVLKWLVSLNQSSKLIITRYIIVFVVLALYALLNLMDFLPGIISILICLLTIIMMCFSSYRFADEEFYGRAMFGFAVFAVSAGVYGMLHGNTLTLTQNGVQLMRFCGTSEDPNIMAYKFLLGLTAVRFTDLIKSKLIKFIMACFLVMVIFRTASTTALIGICLLAILVVILQRKSINKTIIIILGILFLGVILVNIENILIFLSNKNVLGFDGERLLQQYRLFIGGDISSTTSLRTDIWGGYMNYFINGQGAFAQLFGGNVTNIYAIEKNFSGMNWTAAAHNTNIDMLMCIGFVGMTILYVCSLIGLKNDIELYKKDQNSVVAMRITVKILTYFFSWSLSMFLSYGYMIFFL